MKKQFLIYSVIIYTFINLFCQVQAQEIDTLFVSPSLIEISADIGSISENSITISSTVNDTAEITISDALTTIVFIEQKQTNITTETQSRFNISVKPSLDIQPQIIAGYIIIKTKDQTQQIPILVKIIPKRKNFDLTLDVPFKKLYPQDEIKANLEIVNLGNFQPVRIIITSKIKDFSGNVIEQSKQTSILEKENIIPIIFNIPNINKGEYILEAEIQSDSSIEKTASIISIIESQNIPQEIKKQEYPNLFLIAFIIAGMIYSIAKIILQKKTKVYSILIIILLIISGIIITQFLTKEITEFSFPTPLSNNIQNITKLFGISDLTNEPFLKNITEQFIIYIINSSEIKKQDIRVQSTEKEFIISLEDAKLEIIKSGKKYLFSIIQNSQGEINCNFFCKWNFLFLTETIIIIIILISMILFLKQNSTKRNLPKREDDIIQIIEEAEKNIKKDVFKAMHQFFTSFLHLEYEATIEQIKEELPKTKLEKKVSTRILSFLDKLNDFMYSAEHKNQRELKQEAQEILTDLKEIMKINIKTDTNPNYTKKEGVKHV